MPDITGRYADEQDAWEKAGQVPEGFQVNPLWERARREAMATPGLNASVALDWPTRLEGPCVACGTPAFTSYHGRPIHMTCAGQLALYVEMRRQQERQRSLPGPPPLLE